MSKVDNSQFGQRLVEAMELRRVSGVLLSKLSGISQSNITHYRKGDYTPSLDTIKTFCRILMVDPLWLMGMENDKTPKEVSDKSLLHNRLENYLSEMTVEQMRKVVVFVEEFILK